MFCRECSFPTGTVVGLTRMRSVAVASSSTRSSPKVVGFSNQKQPKQGNKIQLTPLCYALCRASLMFNTCSLPLLSPVHGNDDEPEPSSRWRSHDRLRHSLAGGACSECSVFIVIKELTPLVSRFNMTYDCATKIGYRRTESQSRSES